MCLDGEFEINYGAETTTLVTKGESILIPAELKNLVLKPKAKVEILEIYI